MKKRLDTNQRESVWDLPACSVGRYVRVQLERANYLHIAELEVYGEYGVTPRMRKVRCLASRTQLLLLLWE